MKATLAQFIHDSTKVRGIVGLRWTREEAEALTVQHNNEHGNPSVTYFFTEVEVPADPVAAEAEKHRARAARDCFDGMVSMRDAINEYIPMPSLESDLAHGPDDSVFFAVVAEAVITEVRKLREESGPPWGKTTEPLTRRDIGYLLAHLSYELEPQGEPPSWNRLAMAVICLRSVLSRAVSYAEIDDARAACPLQETSAKFNDLPLHVAQMVRHIIAKRAHEAKINTGD